MLFPFRDSIFSTVHRSTRWRGNGGRAETIASTAKCWPAKKSAPSTSFCAIWDATISGRWGGGGGARGGGGGGASSTNGNGDRKIAHRRASTRSHSSGCSALRWPPPREDVIVSTRDGLFAGSHGLLPPTSSRHGNHRIRCTHPPRGIICRRHSHTLEFHGNLESCISLRTMVIKNGRVPTLRAAAGIVCGVHPGGRVSGGLKPIRKSAAHQRRWKIATRGNRSRKPVMILLLDNYDSVTYNLAQYRGDLGCDVEVLQRQINTWNRSSLGRTPERS